MSDPICSLIISLLIFVSVYPLLQSTANVLLLKSPIASDHESIKEQIEKIEGVFVCKDLRCWDDIKSRSCAIVDVTISSNSKPSIVV